MRWYEFREHKDFKRADVIVTVNDNGEEVKIPPEKLQKMQVLSWRWSGIGVLEATIK